MNKSNHLKYIHQKRSNQLINNKNKSSMGSPQTYSVPEEQVADVLTPVSILTSEWRTIIKLLEDAQSDVGYTQNEKDLYGSIKSKLETIIN